MSQAAAHQRRYRQRHKRGEIVLRVAVVEHDLAEALILSERLSEQEALDRARLSEGAGEVIADWASKWIGKYR